MNLQEHLDLLEEAIIRNQSFDMLANKISMELEWIDGEYSKLHSLIFHDVSCFYFVNDSTNDRKKFWKPDEGDVLELSGIHDFSEGSELNLTLASKHSKWLDDYNGGGNIVIEIWTSLLVIEAKSVQIDNTTYDLY